MPTHRGRTAAATRRHSLASHDHDYDYALLLASVRSRFESLNRSAPKLFATNAKNLNYVYLTKIPRSERQVHTCHECRRFIERYGHLVAIGANGKLLPAMWNPEMVPEFYRPAVTALYERVAEARIVFPFFTKQRVWGTPVTGEWEHLSVTAPDALVFRERILNAGQAMAAATENFRTVATALTEFTAVVLDDAIRILQADALTRSEKFLAPVKWLRKLHDRPRGRAGENILWDAISKAPEGYCHPRASMIGSLLEDIAAGMDFDSIKVRFNAKMHPLAYQRPQAPPKAGNIKAAEDVFQKLGLTPALERRHARLDEVPVLWSPQTPRATATASAGSTFGHIKPKDAVSDAPSVRLPTTVMTWMKFVATVLPTAEAMEIRVPVEGRFIALTTAVNPDAPPLLKWDRDGERNPVAWYVYPTGSRCYSWGLSPGWARVLGVVPFPTLWGSRPAPHLGEGALLVIKGARDSRTDSGNALFPETLKDDLHGVRSTIEAYSRTAKFVQVYDGGLQLASGYDVRKAPGQTDCALRVFSRKAWATYQIDRWD